MVKEKGKHFAEGHHFVEMSTTEFILVIILIIIAIAGFLNSQAK